MKLHHVASHGAAGRRRRAHRLLFALAVLGGLTVLSFLPIQDKLWLHTKGRLHVWGHTICFAVLAFALIRSGRSGWSRALLLLTACGLGLTIEFAQHVVNHERLEWLDVLVDVIGSLWGALLAELAREQGVG